jgi:methyl-accepting chemotaxis protein
LQGRPQFLEPGDCLNVDESTPQLGALLALLQAAGVASEAHTAATIDGGFWELMVAAALLTLGLIIATGSMLAVTSRVARPLTKLSIVVQRLAESDTAVEIPAMRRNDELGSMAAAPSIFKANIIDAWQLRKEQAEREQRQLRPRARRRWPSWPTILKARSAKLSKRCRPHRTNWRPAAGTLTATAVRSQKLTTQVAAASEEASTNVRSVASAAEKMTSFVNEISRQVQDSARLGVGAARRRRGSASARLLDRFRLRSSSFGGRDRRNGQ